MLSAQDLPSTHCSKRRDLLGANRGARDVDRGPYLGVVVVDLRARFLLLHPAFDHLDSVLQTLVELGETRSVIGGVSHRPTI